MKNITVKNLRSILDSGTIDLRPITIILGKNNCGKSSFIRIFPLLKQTLEKDTSEPLLWYGQYVDFGDYSNILPRFNNNEMFELSFSLNIQLNDMLLFVVGREENFDCVLTIKFKQDRIYSYAISYLNQHIEFTLFEDNSVSCIINNQKLDLCFGQFVWSQMPKELIPRIINGEKISPKYRTRFWFDLYSEKNAAIKYVLSILKKYLKNPEKDRNSYNLLTLIKPQSKEEILKQLQNNKIFNNKTKDITLVDSEFMTINQAIVFNTSQILVDCINQKLHEEFEHTYYIKPIRASVSRYYRRQGLSIDNVDSDGSNLPMVLHSLGKDRPAFEKWCKETFGLIFSVDENGGQLSLIVEEENHERSNLADTGYGYSQVLPIIVQMWLIKNRYKRKPRDPNETEYTIVIEQPELHLHPAFQAKLVDTFVTLVQEGKKNDVKIKIIFETHSDTMINQLGFLINKKKISPEMVNIILVNKQDGVSAFNQTSYLPDGSISSWPIGFMANWGE